MALKGEEVLVDLFKNCLEFLQNIMGDLELKIQYDNTNKFSFFG